MTVEATHPETPTRSPFADWLGGKSARVAGRLKLGLRTTLTRYGLNRDLGVPIVNPAAKIPIVVRRLEPRDVAALLSYDAPAASAQRATRGGRRGSRFPAELCAAGPRRPAIL